jgi:oligopeptide/dipeptide ABC transporter ATP-binding protein
LIEIGDADAVYHQPMHPYSRALLSAVPLPDPKRSRAKRTELRGEIPSPLNKPSGCGFHPRCPIARPECSASKPPLLKKDPGQFAACPFT